MNPLTEDLDLEQRLVRDLAKLTATTPRFTGLPASTVLAMERRGYVTRSWSTGRNRARRRLLAQLTDAGVHALAKHQGVLVDAPWEDWERDRRDVTCPGCHRPLTWVLSAPPIPRMVVTLYDRLRADEYGSVVLAAVGLGEPGDCTCGELVPAPDWDAA